MHAAVWVAVLLLGAEPPADGTLLFLENCNKFVEIYTEAPIGHVAMVFRDGDEAIVYEACPDRVRRLPLDAYYAELARTNHDRRNDIRVWECQPRTPFAAAETADMRKFLDGRLGQRYSVGNYLWREVGDGTHCAELTANTLDRTDRFIFPAPHRETPQALFKKVEAEYQPRREVTLPPYTAEETWCSHSWRRWGERWDWCRWSCRELVSWAW